MTPLITIHSLSKSFGAQVLFQGLSFIVSKGDQVGIIGPNGAGKSTLLKIIAKQEAKDDGNISYRQGLRIAYVSQFPQFPPNHSILDVVVSSGQETDDIYERNTKASIILGKIGFEDVAQDASSLSGGWKKRLDIARALMQCPDVLLLDEPTNHLDLEGIMWLEQFLMKERLTYLVISHDRYFLENATNRVIEINCCYPNGLFASDGGFSAFLTHKEAFLAGQQERERSIVSQVRDETDWLKRSPKARTTKSLSRVGRAYALMDELSQLKMRNKQEKVELSFEASERETRKLIVAKNITKSIDGKLLFKNIDITISPGMRLGILGKNGTGKTTLMKILAKEMPQDAGTIKYADDLRIVYFDQLRETIPLETTLRNALSPSGDSVYFRGRPIHVNGWARRFLFSSDRLDMQIKFLSGGERARILIARLMLKPADVLFLDEPTNDLDIPTLEIMEESLCDFPGAVVLVTHDRCLMDRIATGIIGLGSGLEHQIFADYTQWEEALKNKEASIKKVVVTKDKPPVVETKKRLSLMEKKELTNLPAKIESVEKQLSTLHEQLEEKDIIQNQEKARPLYEKIGTLQKELDQLFLRWEELEDRNQG